MGAEALGGSTQCVPRRDTVMRKADPAANAANTPAEDPGYRGDGSAEAVLAWALDRYQPRIAVACSFQYTALIHMAVRIQPSVRVFSIDTGRLPEETYACAHEVEQRFGIRIEWYVPRAEAVESLMRAEGAFSFRENVDARRRCCAVRKVEPLQRALSGPDAGGGNWQTTRSAGCTCETGRSEDEQGLAGRSLAEVTEGPGWC